MQNVEVPPLAPLLAIRQRTGDRQRLRWRLRARSTAGLLGLYSLAEGPGGMFGLVHHEVLLKLAIGEGLACQLGISAQVANEDVHNPQAEALGHAAPEAQDDEQSGAQVGLWRAPKNWQWRILSSTVSNSSMTTPLSVEGVSQMAYILPERLPALVRPAFDLVLQRIRSLKRETPRYAVWQNAQQLRFCKASALKGNPGWLFGWLLAGLASGWLGFLAGLAWLLTGFLAGLAWLLAGFLAGLAWLLAGFLAGFLAGLVWFGLASGWFGLASGWLFGWLSGWSGWFGLAPGWLSGWFGLVWFGLAPGWLSGWLGPGNLN